MRNETILTTENLVKRYPGADRNALDGVSLEVLKGEFFGLLGPNGCGKTTLISILCGLLKATSGKAHILGRDVRCDIAKVLPDIGLVPQEIALYPTLSLKQNLQYFGNLYGLYGKKLKLKIAECLEIAQLERFVDKPIRTFSGGMKRRANLVTTLIHDPKLLFLDEPTANVDPQSRNVIFESLRMLLNKGVTMIYTTHYLEEAEQLCNRLAIVDEGKIICQGIPKVLISEQENCKDLGELFLYLTGKNLRDDK